MIMRKTAAILAGLLVLWALFNVLLLLLALVWPELAAAGQAIFAEQDYRSLTTPMYLAFLVLWSLAYAAAGWTTERICREQHWALYMATPHFLYAAYNHLYAMWPLFPPWYNLAVVALIYPLAWLGAGLRARPSLQIFN